MNKDLLIKYIDENYSNYIIRFFENCIICKESNIIIKRSENINDIKEALTNSNYAGKWCKKFRLNIIEKLPKSDFYYLKKRFSFNKNNCKTDLSKFDSEAIIKRYKEQLFKWLENSNKADYI